MLIFHEIHKNSTNSLNSFPYFKKICYNKINELEKSENLNGIAIPKDKYSIRQGAALQPSIKDRFVET